jgi:small-conductance mechanosensitive channel
MPPPDSLTADSALAALLARSDALLEAQEASEASGFSQALANLTLADVALPVGLILSGAVAGWLFERFLLRWMGRIAERTQWRADNVLVRAVRGVLIFWGFALGVYLASLTVEDYPEAVDVLQLLLKAAVWLSLIVVTARVATGMVTAYARLEGSFLPITSIVPTLVRVLVYTTGLLVLLNEFGFSITPILGALSLGGLALALGLQDTLANVAAGLYLIASQQIRTGHYVRIETGEEGWVTDIDWRATTIRTIVDSLVIVPNARLAGAVVANYDEAPRSLRMRIHVPLPYETDLERAEAVVLDVARSVAHRGGARAEAFVHTLGEFSVNLTVLLPIPDYYGGMAARSRFLKALVTRFQAEGIRIPFPIKEFEMELGTDGIPPDPQPGGLERPSQRTDQADSAGDALGG